MKLLELANKLEEINKEVAQDLDQIWVIIYREGTICINNYNLSEYLKYETDSVLQHRMSLDTNPETCYDYRIEVIEPSEFSKPILRAVKLFIELVETGVKNIDIEEYMNSLDKDDKNRIRYEEWKKSPYGFDRSEKGTDDICWCGYETDK